MSYNLARHLGCFIGNLITCGFLYWWFKPYVDEYIVKGVNVAKSVKSKADAILG